MLERTKYRKQQFKAHGRGITWEQAPEGFGSIVTISSPGFKKPWALPAKKGRQKIIKREKFIFTKENFQKTRMGAKLESDVQVRSVR